MLQSLQKYQHLFFTMLMVFVLAPWFIPDSQQFLQLDFWLIWFVAMCVLSLPLTFLEVALAKRSKKMPILGMEELTRLSDATKNWRSVSWLAIILIALLCGGLLVQNTVQHIAPLLTISPDVTTNSYIWLAICFIGMVALSFIAKKLLPLATLVAFVALVMSGINIVDSWHFTSVTSTEWKNAVLLAVTASGLGTGLYWQMSLTKQIQQQKTMLVVIPIWITQLLAGLFFFIFQGIQGDMAVSFHATASFMIAAWLLSEFRHNIQNHASQNKQWFGLLIPFLLIVGATLLWQVVAHSLQKPMIMYSMIAIFSLITIMVYSIFTGWHMKISHLRKSLNFGSETTYNIWRVAVRLLIPMALLSVLCLVVMAIFRP